MSIRGLVCAFGLLIVTLIFWEFFAGLSWIDQSLLSKPSLILHQLVTDLSGNMETRLVDHAFRTVVRSLVACLVGVLLGCTMAFIEIYRVIPFSYAIPILRMLEPMPATIWVFFLIGFASLGYGESPILIAGVMTSLFPTYQQWKIGLRAAPSRLLLATRVLGASKIQEFRYVVLPASLPALEVGLRLSFSRAWRSVLTAEFFSGSSIGLGAHIYIARENFQVERVMSGILCAGLFFVAIESIFFYSAEKRSSKWIFAV